MWKAKLSLEQIKTIISRCIAELDPRQTWMITWLDKVGLRDDSTPYIKVAVHRVRAESSSSFSIDHLDINKPRWIVIPLRLLRVFPVGTLLHNGMAMFGSHQKYLSSFTLDFDTSTEHIRTTLGEWSHGPEVVQAMRWNRLDRFDVREEERFALNSKVVIYPYRRSHRAKFDFVVFPAVELARFYWFPSSRLFRAFVEGKASGSLKNELYVPEMTMAKVEDGEEYHQVILRDNMHLRDAEFIARLAFSAEAYYSVNAIYQSVLNAKLESGNRGALHLDCVFPFRTDTTLKVHGYILHAAGADVLMVTELLQCYGPWPFESLKYDRETPRPEIDLSLKKKGKKHGADGNPEEDSTDQDDDSDGDEDQDDEDRIDGFLLSNPKLSKDPNFDHTKRNNSRVKNAELHLKSQRFPTLTLKKERLKRYRKAPPKNNIKVPSLLVDNISVNDATQKGGTSTNIDLVGTEDAKRLATVDWSVYIEKLCEYFKANGAVVNYITSFDAGEGYDLPCQDELVSLVVQIGRSQVSMFVIYVRMPEIDFILCEMDRGLRTSLKIITKANVTVEQQKAEFTPGDLVKIHSAIVSNYQTLDELNSLEKKSNLKVTRLYHLHGVIEAALGERILARLDVTKVTDE